MLGTVVKHVSCECESVEHFFMGINAHSILVFVRNVLALMGYFTGYTLFLDIPLFRGVN